MQNVKQPKHVNKRIKIKTPEKKMADNEVILSQKMIAQPKKKFKQLKKTTTENDFNTSNLYFPQID